MGSDDSKDNAAVVAGIPATPELATTAPACPPCAIGDRDAERPPPPRTPVPAPRKSPTSVSRLCFPFVTTKKKSSPSPPPSPPPPKHKYSCPTSLLSPYTAGKPLPAHQRHNYRQHGYSRSALHQTKWFWSIREEKTASALKDDVAADTDGNIPSRPRIRRIISLPPAVECDERSPTVPAIHPRRGDITALRDPYCAHVDRSFQVLPTWTISKTLWMHDLHLATETRRPRFRVIHDDSDVSDIESEAETVISSRSTSYTDDTESTLAESESDGDLTLLMPNNPEGTSLASSRGKDRFVSSYQHKKIRSWPPSPVLSPILSPTLDVPEFHGTAWPATAMSFKRGKLRRSSTSNKSPWATNWYHRWEVLKDLSRQDPARTSAFPSNTNTLRRSHTVSG